MSTLSRRALLGTAAAGLSAAATSSAFGAPLRPGERRTAADVDPLIIYQTGFEPDEDVSEWLDANASFDTVNPHSGERSLRYDRTNPSEYILAAVSIPAVGGTEYQLTGSVRVEGLSNPASGAQIGMDCWTEENAWLGGEYSSVVSGSAWTETSATYLAPVGTTRIQVACYLRRNLSGTAWFDDLTVRIVPSGDLATQLLAPTYQGLLMPGDHPEIVIRTEVGVSDIASHSLRFSVIDEAGVAQLQTVQPAEPSVDLRGAAADLAVGSHLARVELLDAADVVIATEEWGVEKVAQAPPIHIDRHRRLVRDGVPTFPIGIFDDRISPEIMERLAGTPFNILLSYKPEGREQLDLAHQHGVSVIYSLKDFYHDSGAGNQPDEIVTVDDEIPVLTSYVEELKDHPALLGWYNEDEPEEDKHERMVAHYDAIVATDDVRHPVYAVHNKAPLPTNVWLRASDVVGIDNYPVKGDGTGRIDQPSSHAAVTTSLLPTRAHWHVSQSFAGDAFGGSWTGHFPTLTEFRNMTWQWICGGATGILYWSMTYMVDEITRGGQTYDPDPNMTFEQAMAIASAGAQEVADVSPVLLSIEEVPEVTVPTAAWADMLVKSHDGQLHIFAVNHTKTAETGAFVVPGAMTVTVVGEDRTVAVDADGAFVDDFAILAVHHYVIDLLSTQALSNLTRDLFGGERGKATAAVGRLERAQQALDRGDRDTAVALIGGYTDFVTEHLGASDAARLVDLAGRLVA